MRLRDDFSAFAKRYGYRIGWSDFSLGRRVWNLDSMEYEDSEGYEQNRDWGLVATAPFRLLYSPHEGIVTRGFQGYRHTVILPANLFWTWRQIGMPHSEIRRRMLFYKAVATEDYEKWMERRNARDLPDRAKEARRKEMDTYRYIAKFTDEWMTHEAPAYQKQAKTFRMGGG